MMLVGVVLGVTGGKITSDKWTRVFEDECDMEVLRHDVGECGRDLRETTTEAESPEKNGQRRDSTSRGDGSMHLLGADASHEEAPVPNPTRSLTVDFCVSGWIPTESAFYSPWGVHDGPCDLDNADDVKRLLSTFYGVVNPQKLILSDQGGKGGGGGDDNDDNDDKDDNDDNVPVVANTSTASTGDISSFVDDTVKKWKGKHRELIHALHEKYGVNALNISQFMRSGRWDKAPGRNALMGRLRDVLQALEFDVPSDEFWVAEEAREEPPSGLESEIYDWSAFRSMNVHCSLRWECEVLKRCSKSFMTKEMISLVGQQGSKEVLKHTIAAGVMSAATVPIAVGSYVSSIDDDWALACSRSDRVGVLLARCWCENGAEQVEDASCEKVGQQADAANSRDKSEREYARGEGDDAASDSSDDSPDSPPQSCGLNINLFGFSFGGRVVYSCLKELLRLQSIWESNNFVPSRPNLITNDDGTTIICFREPRTIVSNAVIMGTPAHVKRDKWTRFKEKQIVAGRLVNCFSSKDVIVRLLFQYKRKLGTLGAAGEVCGAQAIGVEGVEDIDVSHIIREHSDYVSCTREVLNLVGHV